MRIEQDSEKILKKLEKLYVSNYDKTRGMLTTFSVEELEILAVKYYPISPNSERPYPRENTLLYCILLERLGRLNRNFEATAADIEHYFFLNDNIESSLKKAVTEAQILSSQLDKRIKEKDPFVKEYELKIEVIPFIEDKVIEWTPEDENIYFVLGESVKEFSYSLSSLTEKGNLMFDHNWYDLCGMPSSKLAGHHICYFLHEIWEHTVWSLPDLSHIRKVRTEIRIRCQHSKEIFPTTKVQK
jgi:hypothetical protein